MNYKKGIRFKCQGSSNCCVSRWSYGYVYLSQKDIKKFSQNLKLEIENFVKIYCDKINEFIHLKEKNRNGDCQFLKKKRCSVYLGRPTQCRTWQFWSENMNAKTLNKEISKFCPGLVKDEVITAKQI